MTDAVECPQCGVLVEQMGTHWSNSLECECPELDDRKRDILSGIVMGDGHINRQNTPYLQVGLKGREFLEWVYDELEYLSAGITHDQTNGLYYYRTISADIFDDFAEWYDSGSKRFPDLDLTPRMAKVWYCCDGHLDWSSGRQNAVLKISVVNEVDRSELLFELFREHGFDPRITGHQLYFTADETKDVLEWMGDSLPGFEHKWEHDSRERYEELYADY